MKSRHAYSLVELSVCMSAGTALLILAIGMLHQSMTLASASRHRSTEVRIQNRLARQFRLDVHQATQCVVESEARLRLAMPGENEVVYVIDGSNISREQPLDDGSTRRNEFDCGADVIASFASLSQPSRAVLTVARQVQQDRRIDRQVAAVVGRTRSHQNAEVSP